MNQLLNIERASGRHFSLSFTTTLKRPLAGDRYRSLIVVVVNEA
jgi:hypothetical protein